jgi:hypothetical protein
MVVILFSRCISYVNSNHPLLFDYLKQLDRSDLKLIDVNTEPNIDEWIEKAEILIYDASVHESIRAWEAGISVSRGYFHFIGLKEIPFYIKVTEKFINSKSTRLFWGSITDAHSMLDTLKVFERYGLSSNRFFDCLSGVIWFFNSEQLYIDSNEPYQYIDGFLHLMKGVTKSREFVQKLDVEIELPHSVALPVKPVIHQKKWDCTVPGIGYPTRKIATESAFNKGLSIPNLKFTEFAVGKMRGFIHKTRLFSPELSYQLNAIKMNYYTSRSKFSFVCGGPTKYFVLKFIEIPKNHSAMIAYKINNMHDYGFLEGENYLSAKPEDFGEVVLDNKNDIELQHKLTTAAFQNISKLHTLSARAEQLISALNAMKNQSRIKAHFANGSYRINNK